VRQPVLDIEVVLFDFGDTLASERWLWSRSGPLDGWVDAYAQIRSEDLMERWNTGQATTHDVASEVARVLGCDATAAVTAMHERSRHLEFFPSIMEVVSTRRQSGAPQALVTVNPDLFEVVEAHYGLTTLFDEVVVSCRCGTSHKMRLCEIALERLGVPLSDRALLIDNLEDNVIAFAARGGRSYQFVDDQTFAADVRTGRLTI
jgi:FMN phosphatase YigB (HAD superfamily)